MKKTLATMVVAVSMSFVLAACGGSAATPDNSSAAAQDEAEATSAVAQDEGTATKVAQAGNNWMSADDLQAVLERDYGYHNDRELTGIDDENDKTHREEIDNEDGTVKYFVDINYDGKTNEITFINWCYYMNASDIDYWMETLGLLITNPDDQQILKDTLSEVEDMEIRELELSDASLRVFRYGEEDDYPIMNVSVARN